MVAKQYNWHGLQILIRIYNKTVFNMNSIEYTILKLIRDNPRIAVQAVKNEIYVQDGEDGGLLNYFLENNYIREVHSHYQITDAGKRYLNTVFKQNQIYDNIDDALRFLNDNHAKACVNVFIQNVRQSHEIINSTQDLISEHKLFTIPEQVVGYSKLLPNGYECLKIGIAQYLQNTNEKIELKNKSSTEKDELNELIQRLTVDNLQLTNEKLEIEKQSKAIFAENERLDKELKQSQIDVNRLQSKEIKNKVLWIIIGITLTVIIQHLLKSIGLL
jgi:hypothetical protein